MENYITAIDIGTSKVMAAVGEYSTGGIKIVALSEMSLNSGDCKYSDINKPGKVAKAIESCIEKLKEQLEGYDYQIKDAYVGVVSGKYFRWENKEYSQTRINPNSEIEEKEVNKWSNAIFSLPIDNDNSILYVAPQLYNIDENMGETEIVGMTGRQVEGVYKIAVGKQNSINNAKKVLAEAKLGCKGLVLNHIAQTRALLSGTDCEIGVAVIDIGAGTTKVTIIHNNIVKHICTIPFGGNSITTDIELMCNVSSADAEKLKVMHGSCLSQYYSDSKVINVYNTHNDLYAKVPHKKLVATIEARISEILATAAYEIKKSGLREKLRSGVILTGGGSQLTHIQNLANDIFKGMNVRCATPTKKCIISTSVEDAFKAESTTIVGLILKAFDVQRGESHSEIILPQEQQTESVKKEVESAPLTGSKPNTDGDRSKPKKKKEKFSSILGGFGDLFTFSNEENEA